MKKSIVASFFAFLFFACFTACDKDDDLKLTKESGRPSSVNDIPDANVLFYYEGNRLKTIKEIKGTIWEYNYEDGKLLSVYYSPEDKELVDGHGSVRFEQAEDKIYIAAWGEPVSGEYRWELEMDDSGFPQRLTEIGFFSRNEENKLVVVKEGAFYTEFTYDLVKKNLLKLTISEKESTRLLMTYAFGYDDNPGAISKIDLPLWYYAYHMYRNRDFRGGYGRLFYCYANNILEEKVTGRLTDDAALPQDSEIIYSYEYNKEKYPVIQATNYYGLTPLKINY